MKKNKGNLKNKDKRKGKGGSNSENCDQNHSDSRSRKGSQEKNGKKPWNKKNVQCYNCQGWGHFAKECKNPKRPRVQNDEANLVQEEDSEDDHVILMVTTALKGGNREENAWYLDTGCSNHMTRRKD